MISMQALVLPQTMHGWQGFPAEGNRIFDGGLVVGRCNVTVEQIFKQTRLLDLPETSAVRTMMGADDYQILI